MENHNQTQEPITLADVLDGIRALSPADFQEVFISKNPDIQYLGRRSGLPPVFIRRMVAYFKEPIVIEVLRRFRPEWDESVFMGVARKVERETQA